MSGRDSLHEYVAELRSEVGRHRLRKRLVGEVEAHLREAVAVRTGAGVAPDQAAAEAIESFGAPREVAAALERELSAPRWFSSAIAGAAATAAVLLAVVGTLRPGSVSGDRALPGAPDAEAARVAGALRLSPEATDVLATAQRLGRRASTCLLRHGGRADSSGGIRDPSGQARAACLPLIEANDRYLDGPAFGEMLAEAEPSFEAAERCVAAIERSVDAAAARLRPEATRPEASAASRRCHRRDGLPAATA